MRRLKELMAGQERPRELHGAVLRGITAAMWCAVALLSQLDCVLGVFQLLAPICTVQLKPKAAKLIVRFASMHRSARLMLNGTLKPALLEALQSTIDYC